MGLAQVQQLLACIYTDPGVRDRFFSNPRVVGEAFGLTSEEARQLGRMSEPRARSYADSLRRKRFNGVRKLLPLTGRALGRRFAELFERHAEAFTPRGHGKPRQDALAFAAFLERAASAGQIPSSLVAALARYEAANLQAADPARRLTLCWLPAPVDRLVRQAERGAEARAEPPRPAVALWFRPTPRSRLRQAILSLPRLV
jgi:hypothetical protein